MLVYTNGVSRDVAAVPRDVTAVTPKINDNVGFTTAHEPRFADNVAVVDDLNDGKNAIIDDLTVVIDDLDGKDVTINDFNAVIDDFVDDFDGDKDDNVVDDGRRIVFEG